MKFTLAENAGSRNAAVIAESGHDGEAVAEEELSGTSDSRLLAPLFWSRSGTPAHYGQSADGELQLSSQTELDEYIP